MPSNENTKSQIKSRQRVADHGEVFTNPREVNAIFLCIFTKDNSGAENISEYMKTKFFSFFVGIRKNKNMTHDTYMFVCQRVGEFLKGNGILNELDGFDKDGFTLAESIISPVE